MSNPYKFSSDHADTPGQKTDRSTDSSKSSTNFFLIYIGTCKIFKCYKTSNKPTFSVPQVFLRHRIPRMFKENLKHKDKVG